MNRAADELRREAAEVEAHAALISRRDDREALLEIALELRAQAAAAEEDDAQPRPDAP